MHPLVQPGSQAGATSEPVHEDGLPDGTLAQANRAALLTPSLSPGTVSSSSPDRAGPLVPASGGTGPVSVAWPLDPGRCLPCWSSRLFCHCGWYGPTRHSRTKPCTCGLGTWSGPTGSTMSPFPTSRRTFLARPSSTRPIGALTDSAGGLAAARLLSLCLMLGVTALLWATTARLYGRRAALLATGLFATLAGTQFLGAFATYDSMALFLLALAAWLAVRSADCRSWEPGSSSPHRWRMPRRSGRGEVRHHALHAGSARRRGFRHLAAVRPGCRAPCWPDRTCLVACAGPSRPSSLAAAITGWASRRAP